MGRHGRPGDEPLVLKWRCRTWLWRTMGATGVPAQDRHSMSVSRLTGIPPRDLRAAPTPYRLGAGTLHGRGGGSALHADRSTPRLGLQSWRIGGQLPFEGWLHLGAGAPPHPGLRWGSVQR